MPTYTYACLACDHRFEVAHAMADPGPGNCGECGGALRRVIGAVGVTFKGSGFYRTDSRPGRSASDAPARGDSATPVSKPAPSAPSTPASS